jgi:hypothetical protein
MRSKGELTKTIRPNTFPNKLFLLSEELPSWNNLSVIVLRFFGICLYVKKITKLNCVIFFTLFRTCQAEKLLDGERLIRVSTVVKLVRLLNSSNSMQAEFLKCLLDSKRKFEAFLQSFLAFDIKY